MYSVVKIVGPDQVTEMPEEQVTVFEEAMEVVQHQVPETVELTQTERNTIAETAVRTVLNALLTDEADKDLVVVSDGGVHRCHASLMALASPQYVRQMLVESQSNEDGTHTIHLPDVPSYVVETFLNMMYCASEVDSTTWSFRQELDGLVSLLQADFCPSFGDLVTDPEPSRPNPPKPAVSCKVTTLKFNNEKELASKGCNFLRRHGGQHKIPYARTMKVAQLVPAILDHYRDCHEPHCLPPELQEPPARAAKPFRYKTDNKGRCPGQVLDVSHVKELERLGNEFLRSHATRHGITGARNGRSADLSAAILKHYYQQHNKDYKNHLPSQGGGGRLVGEKVTCKHCPAQVGVLVLDPTSDDITTSYTTCFSCDKSMYLHNKSGYRLAVFCPDISARDDPLLLEEGVGGGSTQRRPLFAMNRVKVEVGGDLDDESESETVYETNEEEKKAKKAKLWKKWYGKVGGVKVKCPKCVVYIVRPKANDHEINHHSPNLPHVCSYCEYRTLTKTGIKTHMAKWHSDDKRTLPCSYGCGKFFTSKHLVGYHVKQACRLSPEAAQWKRDQGAKRAKKTEGQKRRVEVRKQMMGQLGIAPPKDPTKFSIAANLNADQPTVTKLEQNTIAIMNV